MAGEMEMMRRIVAAWEGLDATDAPEAFADAPWMDPAVVLETLTMGLPDEQRWAGREQVREGWRRYLSPWAAYRFTGSNLEQIGDAIVFDLHVDATGRGSGVPVTIDQAQVWTWRDGRVVSIRIYDDRAAALEAISRSARGGGGGPRTPPAR